MQKSGFTLLEMMVALFITTIILSITFKSFITLTQFAKEQEERRVIFSRAKKITDVLRDVIHEAGFIGCQRAREDLPITPRNRLKGGDTSLSISAMDNESDDMKQLSQDGLSVILADNHNLKAGERIIIANCKDVFDRKILQKNGRVILLNQPITQIKNAEVGRFNTYYIYFKNKKLYLSLNRHAEKIADGITQFHFLYLVKNQFIPASDVTDWSYVSAVKFTFQINYQNKNLPFIGVANIRGARL